MFTSTEQYLRKIRPFYDIDPVKVITGIGRCGKSVVLSQIASEIRKEVPFKKIVNFILMSNSRIISARSIQKCVSKECEGISINTVLKYIECLKEAYIVDQVPRYSNKAKKSMSYYYKFYDGDVCFNSLLVYNNRYDLDHNLENIVYNELLFRGYDLKVFDNGGKEIDFYACKDGKEYFVQVAYSVLDGKAYDREFGAFVGVNPLAQKILITTDDVDYSTSLVRHIKFKDFLHMESL